MTDSPEPLSAEDVEKVRFYHVTDASGLRCNCGMFEPCHAKRLLATLDTRDAATRALVEAAEAVMEMADEGINERDEPMWDSIPTDLSDRLGALRAAIKEMTDDRA